ncbi:hypothetical protein GTO89_13635 [Heliobacterium gestii]|uniref:FeoB-associated Cys-rich membrane protein n=1 Tax=Heliomicrobium gestii TaxID=2699 RepID=A0A845LI36_HELGE|nr:hypothetical protein [Heliomicrobium gestii]MBM7867682.1 hypothetical protein [Heliomicrobium gestii]MZP44075.1 hypothetical protein [Heliomicrobium gestii]
MEIITAFLTTAILALAIGWLTVRGFYREAQNLKKGTCDCASGGCGGTGGCGGCSGNCGCSSAEAAMEPALKKTP